MVSVTELYTHSTRPQAIHDPRLHRRHVCQLALFLDDCCPFLAGQEVST